VTLNGRALHNVVSWCQLLQVPSMFLTCQLIIAFIYYSKYFVVWLRNSLRNIGQYNCDRELIILQRDLIFCVNCLCIECV